MILDRWRSRRLRRMLEVVEFDPRAGDRLVFSTDREMSPHETNRLEHVLAVWLVDPRVAPAVVLPPLKMVLIRRPRRIDLFQAPVEL